MLYSWTVGPTLSVTSPNFRLLFPASNLICTPSKNICPLSNLIVLVIPSTNIVESSPTSVPFIVPSNVPSNVPV